MTSVMEGGGSLGFDLPKTRFILAVSRYTLSGRKDEESPRWTVDAVWGSVRSIVGFVQCSTYARLVAARKDVRS